MLTSQGLVMNLKWKRYEVIGKVSEQTGTYEVIGKGYYQNRQGQVMN